ncbi:MAG: undecaprenyl-diphosphate phosphatase [Bacteriovoracia bacterium]
MTTFQAIVYAAVYGFSLFIPVGETAHMWAISTLLEWPTVQDGLMGPLSLGACLAVLIYFRHDWASIVSSCLRVTLLWKKPMTLDERMPLFLLLANLPMIVLLLTIRQMQIELPSPENWSPFWVAGSLALLCVPVWLADRLNRRTKNMLSWNWVDALVVGFAQCVSLLPGGGRQIGAFAGGLFRNYSRESCAKFTFLTFGPVLLVQTLLELRSTSVSGISTLTFSMAVAVSFLCGLMAIGSLMKQIQNKGLAGALFYRCLFAAVILGWFWMKNR